MQIIHFEKRRPHRRTASMFGQWRVVLCVLAVAMSANNRMDGEQPPVRVTSANQELARKILGDDELKTVLVKAKKLLASGLNAGSGYGEVWIRDLNTFIELSLQVNDPKPIRAALLTFCKFQGPEGDIVDGFIPREKANVNYKYRRSPLAPNSLAHKNTVETDQESSLVQAVWKYVTVTHDRSILDEQVDGQTVRRRLARAIDYVLEHRFNSQYGLVWGATTADWGDVQPEHVWGVELDKGSHLTLDIYDNAMLIIALDNYIAMLGDRAASSSRYREIRHKLAANVRKHLWDVQRQKFIPHIYLHGSPFPKDFDEHAVFYHGGTAVAIEAGLLSHDEIASSLHQMKLNVRHAGASSIGLTLYPTYPAGSFKNPSMAPYSYQNGGDWCWFGGRMIQQLVRNGFIQEAYQELQPMVVRVNRHGDFHEWWSLDNQPRGSGQFRGSAGVLGIAIQQLNAWAGRNAE